MLNIFYKSNGSTFGMIQKNDHQWPASQWGYGECRILNNDLKTLKPTLPLSVWIFIQFICSVHCCFLIQNALHLPQLSTIPCSCCRTLTPPPSRGPVVPSDRYVIVCRLFKCWSQCNQLLLCTHIIEFTSKTQTWLCECVPVPCSVCVVQGTV